MKLDYSAKTLRAMFGKPIWPTIAMSLADVSQQAQKLAGRLSISGIQPKLSVALRDEKLLPVETSGQYILKPQTQTFSELPQNEYVCMQMGRLFGVKTAENILLELADDSPAYLVKRFDRRKHGKRIEKIPCEDMNQILGGDKYTGSHEQIARAIDRFCTFAPLERQRLFELTLFNFVIGNGDAHKKNFSLLTDGKTVALSPAYDLVSSRLVIPDESDELALSLNGRQNRLTRRDFLAFAEYLQMPAGFAKRRIAQLLNLQSEFHRQIDQSALSGELRLRFAEILVKRTGRLAI
ncbi:MAG: HipA domain-containing protein [Phycisphaerae bacterium]|nr:HipA domain-containing protein [Phycisphaerae bacterium]